MEVNKKRYATIIVLYNPEVVGSSPASATRLSSHSGFAMTTFLFASVISIHTIKSTGFRKKSGAFYAKNSHRRDASVSAACASL